jgi:hypothetical protein
MKNLLAYPLPLALISSLLLLVMDRHRLQANELDLPGTVSFVHDVVPALSRGGCNMGACHGNLNGKGGFKLSLRGEDPDFDYVSITRDNLGRRADALNPGESLLLRKAVGSVPHQGGVRFGSESLEYKLIARWIEQGLRPTPANAPRLVGLTITPTESILVEPQAELTVRAVARFSDGTTRDVTKLCFFEPSAPGIVTVDANGLVRRQSFGQVALSVRYLDQQQTVRLAFVPARPDFVWQAVPANNFIDRLTFAQHQALRMQPAELADDHVFLRRVYLDTIGLLPTADEARAFLNDPRPDKRARVIDALLDRPEFADYWAMKWCDLLRNEEKRLDRKGVNVFHRWIRESIAQNKPFNEFARELIAARGSTYEQPAANYYRALRDPLTRAEATAQVFLGVRIGCARCHNHPFDRWTMQDYYSFAAFFARVQYRLVGNTRNDRFDEHEFKGEQIVWVDRSSEMLHPRSKQPVAPRFLGDARPVPEGDRLQALADWLADPRNPFFARTQVNRIWYYLLGKGLVDPNDDFRQSNPPAIPELLDALTSEFVQSGFNLKHMVRTILNSRTYQLAAKAHPTAVDDEVNFTHAIVQQLEAEQLLDAIAQVTGKAVRFNSYPLGMRAVQLPSLQDHANLAARPFTDAERFLRIFGRPDRLLSCDCERAEDTTLVQSFQLITGQLVNDLLSAPDNRIGRLLAEGKSNEQIVEEFYLAALSRYPTPAEQSAAREILQRSDRRQALEDIVWALLNSKEFVLRR